MAVFPVIIEALLKINRADMTGYTLFINLFKYFKIMNSNVLEEIKMFLAS